MNPFLIILWSVVMVVVAIHTAEIVQQYQSCGWYALPYAVSTLRPISMGAGNRQGKTTVEKGLVKNLLAPTIITDEDFRDEAKALMFKGEFKRAWELIDMVIDKQIRGSA